MSQVRVIVILGVATAALWCAATSQSRDAGPWVDYVAGEYDIVPNITYAIQNNTELKLDVFTPRGNGDPVPALVLFHGGGWVAGMKERNLFQILPYVSMGWVVISVEYRLGSNSLAPAAVEDCRCALWWVARNAARYNIDTTKIVLTGGSAGGHLALITGMLPHGSEFDRACPAPETTRWVNGEEPRVQVAAIVNWFGITDVGDLVEGSNAKHYAVEWFGSLPDRKELARRVSPLTYIRSGLPPVITIHGDADAVVPFDHAVRLHAQLDKAGVPNRLVAVRGGGHGGFDRQTLVRNFADIRDFLRSRGILK